jgi:hypothetical protein
VPLSSVELKTTKDVIDFFDDSYSTTQPSLSSSNFKPLSLVRMGYLL